MHIYDGPVGADVFQACPVAHGQARQIRGAQGGGLDAAGAVHVRGDQVGLELHEEVVGGGAAVHLQIRDGDAGVPLHGPYDVIGLVGQALQGGADQMGAAEAPGDAHDSAPGIPVSLRKKQKVLSV